MSSERTNTTTWMDGCVLTRKMGALQDSLMKYQMYAFPPETKGNGILGGDSDVIVNAIYLRDKLIEVIDKSTVANDRKSSS